MMKTAFMRRWIAVLSVFWGVTVVSAADLGEFSIRTVTPLGAAQLEALRQLIDTEPEAKNLADQIEADAQPFIHANPDPLRVIHYQGLLNSDPRRISTVQQLKEMDGVSALLRHWQANEDNFAAEALRRFILAWALTYEPTGDDVNENKLYPLFAAYHALREGTLFSPEERQTVEAWIREMAQLHKAALEEDSNMTNRFTKRIRLLTIFGMILDRSDYEQVVRRAIERFVEESLYADGKSKDLRIRDTLTYHVSALEPILDVMMLMGDQGRHLYTWNSSSGSSIQKSVSYVVPYVIGDKVREEWTHSKVPLDKERAKAGLDHYQPGRLFEPEGARNLMLKAAYFDPDLMNVVQQLTGPEKERFPDWQVLVNEACHLAAAHQEK